MKIIDGHAHVGYTGGWADVGITEDQLLAQMDQYNIEKTALCNEDNDLTLAIMERHPGRIIGCVYVNPLNQATVDSMEKYFEKGFTAVKLNPLRHAYCADTAALDPVLEKAADYWRLGGRTFPDRCIHFGKNTPHRPYAGSALHPECKHSNAGGHRAVRGAVRRFGGPVE